MIENCQFSDYLQEIGAEKEKKLIMELLHKELEEEIARIPKANPYPYTTDYLVVHNFVDQPFLSSFAS
ncbi:Protein TPX2-like protein [Vigna angularis]|uniref:Protein TPX2-like protein n=1 Tax=Phaseolus angularis TaxID=3914 RepID=A0A8T0L255_PHAAN|nr:Protein TPX2-like protein [Vigna angularis]